MNKSYIPLKNTVISSFGTFLSRVSGIMKFNVVNYLFGAGADTFHSSNNNILCLRKVLGEGPLVNAFLPIFSREKTENAINADKFASNIFTQITIISLFVTILGIVLTPICTKIFLPGFIDKPKEFDEIVNLTTIMLLSTIFFSAFSIAMGLLNAHEKFLSSSIAPIFSNIVFIIFPLLTYKKLGIMSLAWAMVLGSLVQFIIEGIELYDIGYRYKFFLDFKDPYSKQFWKLFFPTSLNYLAQSAISIGLGFFASFLPQGSMTYLRNANTILNAPVGFIGVAISGAIFPIFAKVKHNRKDLSDAFTQGLIFFLFTSIPIAFFFAMYPDIIVNIIFRDISRLVSGSTGKYTQELLNATISAVNILGSVLIPWSASIMIGKLFYSIEKPSIPFYLITGNFIINIIGYTLSQNLNWGADGLIYSDLISGWLTFFISFFVITYYIPEIKIYIPKILKHIAYFISISYISWLIIQPLYKVYNSIESPLFLLIIGSSIFIIGLGIFATGTHIMHNNPITNKKI